MCMFLKLQARLALLSRTYRTHRRLRLAQTHVPKMCLKHSVRSHSVQMQQGRGGVECESQGSEHAGARWE